MKTARGAEALLLLVNEFRRVNNDKTKIHSKIAVEDLCDALNICIYQQTRHCEDAATDFAKKVGPAGSH
jgi:hypothetical protein